MQLRHGPPLLQLQRAYVRCLCAPASSSEPSLPTLLPCLPTRRALLPAGVGGAFPRGLRPGAHRRLLRGGGRPAPSFFLRSIRHLPVPAVVLAGEPIGAQGVPGGGPRCWGVGSHRHASLAGAKNAAAQLTGAGGRTSGLRFSRRCLQGAADYLQQRHSVDLAAAMHSCVSEQRKFIAFRGGGLTWCPAAPG